jgi:hypothetical protein
MRRNTRIRRKEMSRKKGNAALATTGQKTKHGESRETALLSDMLPLPEPPV